MSARTGPAEGRAAIEVLRSVAGLAIWAGHFGLVYMVHALACERDWASFRILGLASTPVLVAALTVLGLGLLWLVFRGSWDAIRAGALTEGGEAEPRFTAWIAAATAAYSALGVLFQAAPVLMVPSC